MRIGIDCINVDITYNGGINAYIFGLLDGFYNIKDDRNKYIIFCLSNNRCVFEKYIKNDNFSIVIIDNYKTILRKIFMIIPYLLNSLNLWKIAMNFFMSLFDIKETIEKNCDLLYTPTTTLNFYNLNMPTIISMHDIQQYHYPEFFTKKELKLRRLTFENSAKYATYFQSSSQFIKDDLLEHFTWLKPNQIVVIPEGVNIEEFNKNKDLDICKKYTLPDKFLFFPAQLWKHKNHITVLKALKKIEKEEKQKIPLVMVGAKYSASDEISDFIKDNNMDYVYYLGKVDFVDLLDLYRRAKFLITAVLYESSSLPILEAAASNTPIIASKTPPNVEMSKNICINMFNPTNVGDCAKTIISNWQLDDEILQEQVDKNSINIKLYSWSEIAKKYLEFIKKSCDVK